jgi:NMD protein affecting ribosome stability and mRNA decay
MRRERSKTHPAASQPRTERTPERQLDSYGLRGKLPDPTVCTTCGALYRDGRWVFGAAPADANRTTCPACRRIEDDYPAGIVSISGGFAVAHADEIEHLARNVEKREKQEHALKRIMSIEREAGETRIKTTDAKLARGIGEALHHAYHGAVHYRMTEAENVLRVDWKRED